MAFFDFFTSDIAIDLGTANTLIIYKDKIVVDEPSIIAMDKVNNKVLAIGREAMQMHEKTHDHIKTIRPLKEGVIADFQAAEMMIRGSDQNDRYRQAPVSTILPDGDLYSFGNYRSRETCRTRLCGTCRSKRSLHDLRTYCCGHRNGYRY